MSTDKYTLETITDIRPGPTASSPSAPRGTAATASCPASSRAWACRGAAERIDRLARLLDRLGRARRAPRVLLGGGPGRAVHQPLSQLREGDSIHVERRSYGFLTTDRFEAGRDLWMLATGTGLAPFLSILHDFETWERYENLVLVQSVRTQAELAYEDLIRGFEGSEYYGEHRPQAALRAHRDARARPGDAARPRDQAARQRRAGGERGNQARSRALAHHAVRQPGNGGGLAPHAAERGYRMSRRGEPGHLAVENYW
jgi:ferredoxin--NADP+ reductase